MRWKVGSAASISVWQHVKLSVQIRPWDTLACCWDVKQPTNKHCASRAGIPLPRTRTPGSFFSMWQNAYLHRLFPCLHSPQKELRVGTSAAMQVSSYWYDSWVGHPTQKQTRSALLSTGKPSQSPTHSTTALPTGSVRNKVFSVQGCKQTDMPQPDHFIFCLNESLKMLHKLNPIDQTWNINSRQKVKEHLQKLELFQNG